MGFSALRAPRTLSLQRARKRINPAFCLLRAAAAAFRENRPLRGLPVSHGSFPVFAQNPQTLRAWSFLSGLSPVSVRKRFPILIIAKLIAVATERHLSVCKLYSGKDAVPLLISLPKKWTKIRKISHTIHKILQGLTDCARLLDDSEALRLACSLASYIRERFRRLSYWKIDGILRCARPNPVNEFGGLGDALYQLYGLTGNPEHLETAELFDREYFLSPLAQGIDLLTDLHANTHLPMILAAMRRYETTGETKYRDAVLHFARFLEGRTFANGNTSSRAAHPVPGGVSERAVGKNHGTSQASILSFAFLPHRSRGRGVRKRKSRFAGTEGRVCRPVADMERWG